MFHRVQFFARRNLANIGASGALGTFHVDESAAAASACPRRQLDLLEILDEKGFHDGDPLSQLPFVIVGDVIHHIIQLHRRLGHIFLRKISWFLSYTPNKSKITKFTSRSQWRSCGSRKNLSTDHLEH